MANLLALTERRMVMADALVLNKHAATAYLSRATCLPMAGQQAPESANMVRETKRGWCAGRLPHPRPLPTPRCFGGRVSRARGRLGRGVPSGHKGPVIQASYLCPLPSPDHSSGSGAPKGCCAKGRAEEIGRAHVE